MIKTKVFYLDSFPTKIDFANSVLIYDVILEKKYKKFISKFSRRIKVQPGEGLKDLSGFPEHMIKISKLAAGISVQDLKIVAMGGGSVGDFAGFVASVYKRGVELIQIPTTWLSAIDSSHGGKTALNLAGVKNQIGSFYPATTIFLVKAVFTDLPESRITEVLGEYYKIGLIQGGVLWKKMCTTPVIDAQFLWKLLPSMIKAKTQTVNKDPYEKSGTRHVLNLGHTIGHVLETSLSIPHGTAVLYGLRFAYEFGRRLGLTSEIKEIEWMLPTRSDLRRQLKKTRNFEKKLAADKKTSSKNKIRFVFIARPGKILLKPISIVHILLELKRQEK